jgi:hypothetical protein
MVREPNATVRPTPQDDQLMSKHRVLSFKPQLRLEWRGKVGQSETAQPNRSASLGDSITSSTRMSFSVHTGLRNSKKVAESIKLRCRRADDIWENPAVIQDVVSLIDHSRVVICDCTGRNPNVFPIRIMRRRPQPRRVSCVPQTSVARLQ